MTQHTGWPTGLAGLNIGDTFMLYGVPWYRRAWWWFRRVVLRKKGNSTTFVITDIDYATRTITYDGAS
jgi:hypothetical protein